MILTHGMFRRLCLARELLSEVTEDPQSVAEVARSVGISPFHFMRRFEAVFGATPHQYRIESRLNLARDLLARDTPVTDVCMAVGFSSLGSFSALFTRRVGMPPSRYRARARTIIQVPALPPPHIHMGCLALMTHLPPNALRSFREA